MFFSLFSFSLLSLLCSCRSPEKSKEQETKEKAALLLCHEIFAEETRCFFYRYGFISRSISDITRPSDIGQNRRKVDIEMQKGMWYNVP